VFDRRPIPIALLWALLAATAAVAAAPRVVTLSPSVTSIVVALGAGSTLVGVDDASARFEPRVRNLPRVGGLFNPSLEAIVALAPSFVALVPSAQQRQLQGRLEALGIEVLALPNITYDEVLRSIETLGERVGRAEAGRARADAIRAAVRAARERATGTARPRTLLVLEREPLYVVGGGSYLGALLDAAGADNLARGFEEPYPRVSIEWLIAAAPELILDAADPAAEAASHWSHWTSLPAVARGQVRAIDRELTIPGPYLDRALARLAGYVREASP
jgi:ABC-type Fe3+-hydroxamate transport system substrate-binding protein